MNRKKESRRHKRLSEYKLVIAVCGSDNQFSYLSTSWNLAGDLIQLRTKIFNRFINRINPKEKEEGKHPLPL